MDCSLAMAMMGTHNTKLQILQWQLAMMSADSLHSVAAMMRDHLCWLHLYVVLYHYDGIKVEEMRDKEEYAGGEWCKI